MRPMRPRQAGGPHEMLIEGINEVGQQEKRPTAGLEIVANFLGKSPWTLRDWTDPTKEGEVDLVRLHQIAARWKKVHAFARHFAALAGGVFIPLDTDGIDPKWDELNARTAEDMGRLMAEIVRDLADGKIDRVEAGRCIKIQHEVLRHQLQLNARLRAVLDGRDP